MHIKHCPTNIFMDFQTGLIFIMNSNTCPAGSCPRADTCHWFQDARHWLRILITLRMEKTSPGVEIFFVGAVVTDNMSRWCYLCAVKMIKRNHNFFSFSIAIKISWFKLWSNVHTTKDQDLRQFLFYYWPVSGFKRKYFVLQIENADSKKYQHLKNTGATQSRLPIP